MTRPPPALLFAAGALVSVGAVAAALVQQARTGRGEFIDVSLLESTVVAMGWAVSNYLVAGQEPRPMGNDNMTAAPSGAFRCRDGLLNIAANKQEQFEALCRSIDRADLFVDGRFAGREQRKANRRALTAEIEAALARESAEFWERELNRVGVPAGRVLTVAQVLQHPQIRERGLLRRFDRVEGLAGPVTVTRAGFRLERDDPAPRCPPPALGEHTDAVLAEAGLLPAEIEELRRQGIV